MACKSMQLKMGFLNASGATMNVSYCCNGTGGASLGLDSHLDLNVIYWKIVITKCAK